MMSDLNDLIKKDKDGGDTFTPHVYLLQPQFAEGDRHFWGYFKSKV